MRMNTLTAFFDDIFTKLSSVDFQTLAIADFSAFAAIFVICLATCIFSRSARARDKRVFLCAVNIFTAITFAVFACTYPLGYSAAFSAAFWCVGYLLYGLLSLFKGDRVIISSVESLPAARQSAAARVQPVPAPAPAVPSGVRLEHALAISDKLLAKNLGRGDRQELEKMKSTLTLLKVKPALTPQETEQLNEIFNALLKFMAKYDL